MLKRKVGLIGAGAAGTSLLLALYQKGIQITGVASRSLGSAKLCSELVGNCEYSTRPAQAAAQADLVIIATPDGAISEVCQQIIDSAPIENSPLFIHLSGALTSDELASAQQAGARTLSFHPIQAFSDPQLGARLLEGTFFCLEGSRVAITEGERWIRLLGGRSFSIEKSQKSTYHTALSISSNYLIVIEYIASHLLKKAGIEPQLALQAIQPLIEGSVCNLKETGLPHALSGPISRGDTETIKKHLLALDEQAPELKLIYQKLGQSALELAQQKGKADSVGLTAIAELLDDS